MKREWMLIAVISVLFILQEWRIRQLERDIASKNVQVANLEVAREFQDKVNTLQSEAISKHTVAISGIMGEFAKLAVPKPSKRITGRELRYFDTHYGWNTQQKQPRQPTKEVNQ